MSHTIAVILAVYNEEVHVEEAVASIQAQTIGDWEMLVIDDGSTDRTNEILCRLAANDERIRVLTNSQNQGLAASLNRGIWASSSKYIARMDADDLSYPTRFEKQLQYLRDHPDVAVVGTGARIIDFSGSPKGQWIPPAEHQRLVKRMPKVSPFFHSTVMGRRDFFETMGGYNDAFRKRQDYELWARAHRAFLFGNVAEVLLDYRSRGSESASNIIESVYPRLQVAWKNGFPVRGTWYGLCRLAKGIFKKLS